MNSAIISGAFGTLGAELVDVLLSQGTKILAIGRLPQPQAKHIESVRVSEALTNVFLSSQACGDVSQTMQAIDWKPHGECVFFNLAWGESGQLATPSVEQQVSSCTLVAAFVELAKAFGCRRFVQAGSQQERFVDDFLENDWKTRAYPTSQGIYGAAKLIGRDIGAILCYLSQIDFINVRFSAYVANDLSGRSYIASSLRAICEGREFPAPTSNQWTEIVLLSEVARGFACIGRLGKNKADYYIGSGRPRKLVDYFSHFGSMVAGTEKSDEAWLEATMDDRVARHFDPLPLLEDTGFRIEEDFADFARRIVRK